MRKFGVNELNSVLRAISVRLEQEKALLCELDGQIGDGDHGTTMAKGFNALVKALPHDTSANVKLADVFRRSADTFLNAVGATVGPLYSAAFTNAANSIGDQPDIDIRDVLMLFVAFDEGIRNLGKAEIGDKTMVDVWASTAHIARIDHQSDRPLESVFADIVENANRAAASTATMVASKGRAAKLGERSLGHKDPGAVSAAIIIETFIATLSDSSRS